MKRNLKTINTMKIPQKTLSLIIMVQFYHFGVSQLKKAEESMYHQFAGILDIKTYSQLDMVLTTF